MSDPVDDVLGRLCEEPLPFRVDWPAYEQELWTRAARSETRRRRRTTWSFAAVLAAGLVIGAGLPLLLRASSPLPELADVTTQGTKVPQTAEPVVKAVPSVLREDIVRMDVGESQEGPFTRQFKRPDGRLAEIRFEGFTSPDDAEPGRLVLAAPSPVRRRGAHR